MEPAGHRAVVTGGGGGLGEVIAHALAANGMHVLVADVDGEAARRVADALRGRVDRVERGARDRPLRIAGVRRGEGRAHPLHVLGGGWAARFGVRVSCVIPGWIGLPRALDEFAAIPPGARPALIPPDQVACEVLALVTDAGSGGRVVLMREGEPARILEA